MEWKCYARIIYKRKLYFRNIIKEDFNRRRPRTGHHKSKAWRYKVCKDSKISRETLRAFWILFRTYTNFHKALWNILLELSCSCSDFDVLQWIVSFYLYTTVKKHLGLKDENSTQTGSSDNLTTYVLGYNLFVPGILTVLNEKCNKFWEKIQNRKKRFLLRAVRMLQKFTD